MALSKGASFLVGCGIAVVLVLVVGLVVVWRGKKIEDEKRFVTSVMLIRLSSGIPSNVGVHADGSGSDWTGQEALGLKPLWLDGWGNPIRYRCPGPIHKHGWDLWSCGPNGRDDHGTFDDILVGEDIAPESSR